MSEKTITLKDCRNLYDKFIIYTETAEQHEFPILAKTQLMMEASLKKWENEVDQKEAAAMFRVIKKITGISL
jgi:hypothetical protein